MNFIQNYLKKRTNNMIAAQDFELAEQLMNADLSFQHTDKDENDKLNSKNVGLRISTIDENNIWLRYNNPKIKIKIMKNPLKNNFYNFHFKHMLSAKVF